MNNSTVEKVNSFKYLGVTIDANLKWKAHINTVTRKMCNSMGILRRIKPFVPQSSLITIYIQCSYPIWITVLLFGVIVVN